jgi:uncharacterized iron-regulated membrane protein
MAAVPQANRLYRTIWRWHFYAGVFVVPMVLLLALTGAVYLFKPQLDRWEERDFRDLSTAGAVSPARQVDAALGTAPGAAFYAYRLPEHSGDAAMVHVGWPGTSVMRDIYVSPQGEVLGSIDPQQRLSETVKLIHGSLLLGTAGDWLVELAASWAIVMILTGLYLWWPRGRRLAGVVWPRLRSGSRLFWRDLHAVTGFWVAGLALVLLVSGLPWASVWGGAFASVRQLGWVSGPPTWSTGAASVHGAHDHAAMAAHAHSAGGSYALLDRLVPLGRAEAMAFPVLILPPGAPQPFAPPTGNVWTIKSDAQNRTVQESVTFDPQTAAELSRETFADRHAIDRVVNTGIAWHEGQLFGWINQLIGVLTALMLVMLAVSGFVMWRRRKPAGALGAPPMVREPARLRGAAIIALALALLLPLLAASLVVLWLLERLIFTRSPALARWLGLPSNAQA